MFIPGLLFYFLFIPSTVHGQCYSTLSSTWICDGQFRSNNFTYQAILSQPHLENFFFTNHRLEAFTIDIYSPTLRLLNASGNQLQSVSITPAQRRTSQLHQLVLESNNLAQFSIDTIALPEALEKISLANNRLTILDARLFAHSKNLKEIDLRNNRLKRVLPDLLLDRNVRLDYNPLDCQCTSEVYRTICERATSIRQSMVSWGKGGDHGVSMMGQRQPLGDFVRGAEGD